MVQFFTVCMCGCTMKAIYLFVWFFFLFLVVIYFVSFIYSVFFSFIPWLYKDIGYYLGMFRFREKNQSINIKNKKYLLFLGSILVVRNQCWTTTTKRTKVRLENVCVCMINPSEINFDIQIYDVTAVFLFVGWDQ